jgi:hypothetical protein
LATLEERVGELEGKVKDLLKEISDLKIDLQIVRDHLKLAREGAKREVPAPKPIQPTEPGEERPVKLFPDIGKRAEDVEELVYSYVRRKGRLVGIAACAEELGLRPEEVKRALVSLKLKGKVEF